MNTNLDPKDAVRSCDNEYERKMLRKMPMSSNVKVGDIRSSCRSTFLVLAWLSLAGSAVESDMVLTVDSLEFSHGGLAGTQTLKRQTGGREGGRRKEGKEGRRKGGKKKGGREGGREGGRKGGRREGSV